MAHIDVAYVAGKSGGHIIPCLTLFKMHKKEHPDARALFFTSNTSLDKTILPDATPDMIVYRLPLHRSTRGIVQFLMLFCALVWSAIYSFVCLLRHRPQRVVTTGGITAVPVCIAAFILRIPIDLYELNAIAGKASRLLAVFATRIMTCFLEGARSLNTKKNTILVPYPIRFNISDYQDQKKIKNSIAFETTTPTVLILGGSQGSLQLNALAKQTLAQYKKPLHVIHQTGSKDADESATWYQTHGHTALVFAYRDDLAPYMSIADVIICRAGAGSLFECMAFNKPMIIIPLEGVADDHQVANAYACQRMYPKAQVLRQKKVVENAMLLTEAIENAMQATLAPSESPNIHN